MELSFGLRPTLKPETTAGPSAEVEDLVIIGGGIAGFSAALYAARAQLNPLVIIGNALGGQAAMTESMENYPGFPDGVGGVALSELVQRQSVKFGARLEYDEVTEAVLTERPFKLKTMTRTIAARAVIIATGAMPRKLDIPGEGQFIGRGVFYCATCDGYFYRDKVVAVIGGGNSAIDEGLYLARLAKKVYVVHRRDQLRCEKVLETRAFQNPKMEFIWNAVPEEILGESHVTAVRLKDVKNETRYDLPVDGVFEYVGFKPNTDLFKGQIELDEMGYIVTDKHQRTSIAGVFAAGDVQSAYFRQVVIAAGTGAVAALEAAHYLDALELIPAGSTVAIRV